MVITTGNYKELGISYESGTNAGLLSAIARSAEELTSGVGWPDGVNGLLESLGRVTGVSRVWIFQTVNLTDTHVTQNYTFEWAAASEYKQIGMPMFSMFTNPIDRPEYREVVESRKRGEWQKVNISQLKSGWLYDTLAVQNIKSMLTIPVMVEGQWWGTLGFDDCERDYDWSDAEIALLKTAGYLISNAVLRDRLSAKRKQFDILKSITESSAWAYDFKTRQVWCSSELLYSVPIWCSSELLYSVPMPSDSVRFSLHSGLRWVYSKDRSSFLQSLRDYVKSGKDVFRADIRLINDCGGLKWVELIGNIRRGETGKPEQFAGIAVDIRARKQEEERLLEEATTDSLTGVMNRRMFERVLREQVDSALNDGSSFALLLLDIDYFKGLNDKYGHSVGDELLCYFTDLCSESLGSQGMIARLGGDEFALLLPGFDHLSARRLGEVVRQNVLRKPYYYRDSRVFMTTSIGLDVHTGGVTSSERVLKNADMALYAAKKAGRNCLISTSDNECRYFAGEA